MQDFSTNNDIDLRGEKTCCEVLKEEVLELRWRVLVVACFLTFGSYYIYDFPGSIGIGVGETIGKRFNTYGKEYTQEMNQLLYSVYSWPNTVLAIFGGILMDKYLGIRFSMLLFTFLVLLGSLFFWMGVFYVNYPLMVTARVIFGLGGESLSVAQSAYVARWFKSARGMALAFGITISFARVGSSFNFLLSPRIAQSKGVDIAALVGILSCGISLVACCVLTVADIYAVRIGYIHPESHNDRSTVMKFSDVLRLPFAFWALTAICVFCYCAVFPFVGIGSNFFEVKYNYTGSEASSYMSAYQFASAAGSPVIGFLVDTVGRNTMWLILASACFIVNHLLLSFTMIPGIVLMIMMGMFYSVLVSGLWPSIPWVVNENVMGLSYGIMTALQNAGMAIFPIIVGKVLDEYTPISNASKNMTDSFLTLGNESDNGPLPTLKGYMMTEVLFIGAAFLSLLASIVLLISDLRHDGILTVSSSFRRQIQAEKENALIEYLTDSERNTLYVRQDL